LKITLATRELRELQMTRNTRNIILSAASFIVGLYFAVWTLMLADRSAWSDYAAMIPELEAKATVTGSISLLLLVFSFYLITREIIRNRSS